MARQLNVIALGDELATSLGQHVERTRLILVGTPRCWPARREHRGPDRLRGPDHPPPRAAGHRQRLPLLLPDFGVCSAPSSSSWRDTAARTIFDPQELPVGVLTAVLGGPVFIMLVEARVSVIQRLAIGQRQSGMDEVSPSARGCMPELTPMPDESDVPASLGSSAHETSTRATRRHEELVLRSLNLEIGEGEVVALVGPNGSGKSTLLRALGRVLKPRTGVVYLDGRTMREWPTREVARRLALLPQGPTLANDMTVRGAGVHGPQPAPGHPRHPATRGRRGGAAGRSGRPASARWRAGRSRRSRAASVSASGWRWRWRSSPRSSCWTSRRPSSTSTTSSKCWTSCATSTSSTASRWSWCCTTSTRRRATPAASWC